MLCVCRVVWRFLDLSFYSAVNSRRVNLYNNFMSTSIIVQYKVNTTIIVWDTDQTDRHKDRQTNRQTDSCIYHSMLQKVDGDNKCFHCLRSDCRVRFQLVWRSGCPQLHAGMHWSPPNCWRRRQPRLLLPNWSLQRCREAQQSSAANCCLFARRHRRRSSSRLEQV